MCLNQKSDKGTFPPFTVILSILWNQKDSHTVFWLLIYSSNSYVKLKKEVDHTQVLTTHFLNQKEEKRKRDLQAPHTQPAASGT